MIIDKLVIPSILMYVGYYIIFCQICILSGYLAYSHCFNDSHVYIAEESNLGLGSASGGKADSGSGKSKWTDNDNLKWKLISSLSSTVSTQKDTNVREFFVLLLNK